MIPQKSNIENTIKSTKDSNNQEIWRNVSIAIKNAFGTDHYDKWFSKLDLYSWSEHEVIMSVPSKFLRDWITKEYLNKKFSNHKNIKEVWIEKYPNLKKISIIFIDPAKAEASKKLSIVGGSNSKINQNSDNNKNIISISKHDNIFLFWY